MQDQTDQYATVKATIELLTYETAELREHFRSVSKKLTELEGLAPEERCARFRAMESEGIFQFNGVDVRIFAKTSKMQLSPALFVSRTRRRLENTQTLLDMFQSSSPIQYGDEFASQIKKLLSQPVDSEDIQDVKAFRCQTEELRTSRGFESYMSAKIKHMSENSHYKDEVDILASKEAALDGEMYVESQIKELHSIQESFYNGEIDANDTEQKLKTIGILKPSVKTSNIATEPIENDFVAA